MSMPGMEITPYRDLSTNEARTITERIKLAVGDLMILVAKAWQGRVWIALEYESWADYVKGEFNHAPLSLPRDERKAVVALLRGQGMSTRAIGPAIGVGHVTISRDLSTVTNETVEEEPAQVTGLDGRVRNYSVTCNPPEAVQPAPPQTITCPTCGGTGKVTQ